MRAMSVREFMQDGYFFSTMSLSGSTMYTYNYSDEGKINATWTG